MATRASIRVYFPVFFLACLGLIGPVSSSAFRDRFLDPQWYVQPQRIHPTALRLVTGEFGHSVGSALWLDTNAYLGDRLVTKTFNDYEAEWLYRALQQQLTVDPYYVDYYTVASSFFSGLVEQPSRAANLLIYGAVHRTEGWRNLMQLGHLFRNIFREPQLAADTWKLTARIEQAPSYMAALATMAKVENADIDDALIFLDSMGAGSTLEAKDARSRELQKMHSALKDVQFLQEAIARYTRARGVAPASIQDLVRAGLLSSMPIDPWGEPYILSEDGTTARSTTRLVPSKQPKGKFVFDRTQLDTEMAYNLLDF